MRKPRDFDAELKTLDDKTRQLKECKLRQLGELVIATGADGLSVEELAGALLHAADNDDLTIREEWRAHGDAFFHSARRNAARGAQSGARSAPPRDGNAQSAASETSPA
jgi:hypothetical protein